MNRRWLYPALSAALILSSAGFVSGATLMWPPWLSIEAPVNPFDASARGAVLLVHAQFHEGRAQLSDLTGSAEGLVNGVRRSIALRFEDTGRPNVFALRRQWPNGGAWLVRIELQSTTAIVTFDPAGNIASIAVPTQLGGGHQVPRAVATREIDSTLAQVTKR